MSVESGDKVMELDEFIWAPKQTCRFYGPLLPPPMEVTTKLESSFHKFDGVLLDLQRLSSVYKDIDDKYKILRERLADDHGKILFCLGNLGFICAYEAVKLCLENIPKVQEKCEFYGKSIRQYESSLQEALSIIEESCPGEHKRLVAVVNGGLDATDIGLISSKLHELLEMFRTFRKTAEVLCIVFFERMIAAEVIERVIKKAIYLSHVNVRYITGSNSVVGGLSPKASNEALESLHSGKVNILFSTDVVEEGYQLPRCSHIIYFDLPQTVNSFVQSPGQVHLKDSHYIIMLERGNNKQIDHISYITGSQISMTHAAMNKDPDCLRGNKKQLDHVFLAALPLLKELEAKGISLSNPKNDQPDQVSVVDVESSTCSDGSGSIVLKKHKTILLQSNILSDQLKGESTEKPSVSEKPDIHVVPPIKIKKGGPRISLHELCKKLHWPLPSYDTMVRKSRTLIQFGDAEGFNSFTSEISLTTPDFGVIKLSGEARADKKSSFDSAAVLMLYELQRLGKIIISK